MNFGELVKIFFKPVFAIINPFQLLPAVLEPK